MIGGVIGRTERGPSAPHTGAMRKTKTDRANQNRALRPIETVSGALK